MRQTPVMATAQSWEWPETVNEGRSGFDRTTVTARPPESLLLLRADPPTVYCAPFQCRLPPSSPAPALAAVAMMPLRASGPPQPPQQQQHPPSPPLDLSNIIQSDSHAHNTEGESVPPLALVHHGRRAQRPRASRAPCALLRRVHTCRAIGLPSPSQSARASRSFAGRSARAHPDRSAAITRASSCSSRPRWARISDTTTPTHDRCAGCDCCVPSCQVDFSSLSRILSSLLASQAAFGERLAAVEANSKTGVVERASTDSQLRAVQSEIADTAATLGDLRVGLGKLRGVADDVVSIKNQDYARRADLPCSRGDFEALKLTVAAINGGGSTKSSVSGGGNNRDQDNARMSAAMELQTLKTEVAELQLANANLSTQLRTLDNDHRTLVQRLASGDSVTLLNSQSSKPLAASTQPKLGATATAMMLVGKGGVSALPEAGEDGLSAESERAHSILATELSSAAAPAPHDSGAAISMLTSQVSVLHSKLSAMELDLLTLRSGFKDVHVSMPVPFVASGSASRPATAGGSVPSPFAAAAPAPTMIAVSLECNHCAKNAASTFCVHCPPALQKLCSGCDALVHAHLAPSATPGETATSMSGRRAAAGTNGAQATGAAVAQNLASKHLRLDISRTIEPGSRLLTNDLGYIKHQSDNAALTQLLDANLATQKALEEQAERLDRHELQFSSLGLSLNAVDEVADKLSSFEKGLQNMRTKAAETERALKDHANQFVQLKETISMVAVSSKLSASVAAAAGSAQGAQSLAGMTVVSSTNTPVTATLAKQLHTELDAHKRTTEMQLGELQARFDTFKNVEVEGLTSSVTALQRTAVNNKSHLAVIERVVALEQSLRSLSNSQGFTATKLTNHVDSFAEMVQSWSCQHCDNTHALAFGGSCVDPACRKRICWDCAKSNRGGHGSEITLGGGGGGGDGSSMAGGRSDGVPNAHAIQVVLENASVFRGVQSKVGAHSEAFNKVRRNLEGLHTQLDALVDLLAKMHLIAPNLAAETGLPQTKDPYRLGASSSILLDSRASGYFDALSSLFNQTLPELLTKLLQHESRSDYLGENLAKLEKQVTSMPQLASRPFVEDRVAMLTNKIALLEKGMLKKLRGEVRRVESESEAKRAKEKADREGMGIETSIARVHFRCLACDQVVAGQPGPMSKEYTAQLLAHQAAVHGVVYPPHASTVGGFASAVPVGFSSALQTGGPGVGPFPPSAGVVSSERGHMFIDPGTRIALHSNTGNEVYRGREDTRVSFTSTAGANVAHAHPDGKNRTATFHTAYTKVSGRFELALLLTEFCQCFESVLTFSLMLCAIRTPWFRRALPHAVLAVAQHAITSQPPHRLTRKHSTCRDFRSLLHTPLPRRALPLRDPRPLSSRRSRPVRRRNENDRPTDPALNKRHQQHPLLRRMTLMARLRAAPSLKLKTSEVTAAAPLFEFVGPPYSPYASH